MSPRAKKGIVILAAVVVLGAIGIGVYFGIQNAKQAVIPGSKSSEKNSFPISPSGSGGANQGSGGGISGTQGQAAAAAGGIFQSQKSDLFQLSTHPAVGYWVTSPPSTASTTVLSGILHSGVYYLDASGTVFQVQDVGNEQVIAGSSFGTPLRLWQNNDGSKIVALFAGPVQGADATSSPSGRYALFSLATKAWEVLPQGTVSVAFSPDGKKLASLRQQGGTALLYVTTIAAARQTTTLVASLALVGVSIAWPSPDRIYFVPQTSSSIDSQAWYINPTTKRVAYFTHGNGLQLVFDPVAPYTVLQFVSSADGSSVTLSVDNSMGATTQTLSLQTVAEKCSFSSDGQTIFCAVPRENNKSSGDPLNLPDDFLQKAAYFHDNLYQIKGSAISTLINAPDVLLDMVDIKSTPTQLFFMNRLDRTLYLYNLSGL